MKRRRATRPVLLLSVAALAAGCGGAASTSEGTATQGPAAASTTGVAISEASTAKSDIQKAVDAAEQQAARYYASPDSRTPDVVVAKESTIGEATKQLGISGMASLPADEVAYLVVLEGDFAVPTPPGATEEDGSRSSTSLPYHFASFVVDSKDTPVHMVISHERPTGV